MKDTPPEETLIDTGDAPTMITLEGGMHSPPSTPPSAALEDRYVILETHGGSGESGMGVVFIVEEKTAGEPGGAPRRFAVKTFQPRFGRHLEFIERFIRESETWMLVGFHPNVVHAYRLEISYALPYLFMEYVPPDGQRRNSLAQYLRGGALPPRQAVTLGIQCCDGMRHAGAAVPGLVHRDLKPDNLLIDANGRLKVSDFGLVRATQPATATRQQTPGGPPSNNSVDTLTQAGLVFGTPAYMSPEQFRDPGSVTAAADIYAFGCCLYECLTGRPPFQVDRGLTVERIVKYRRHHLERTPEPVRTLAPDCPEALDALVTQCLQKNPPDRPGSFAEIRGRLAGMLESHFGQAAPSPPSTTAAAREVAEQFRSLGVLRGYRRAVRMRHLREGREISPYAFHLALGSYFHCHGDSGEERRQLEMAVRVRVREQGYEAVRRLGDLLVEQGALEEARALLDDFLKTEGASLDTVLEPYVRMLAAQGDYDNAEVILGSRPETLRIARLRMELLRQRGHTRALADLLERLLRQTLERIHEKTAELGPDSVPGWAYPDDPGKLQEALALLEPKHTPPELDKLPGAVWPDLSGAPDFAPELAWLACTAGLLAELEDAQPPARREQRAAAARVLGYPGRLREQLERDEYWFWLRETREQAE